MKENAITIDQEEKIYKYLRKTYNHIHNKILNKAQRQNIKDAKYFPKYILSKMEEYYRTISLEFGRKI